MEAGITDHVWKFEEIIALLQNKTGAALTAPVLLIAKI